MLSAGEASHMVRVISQRLDANSCGWEQCRKYTPRVKEWGRRRGSNTNCPTVLCTGFRMVPACLWPSEASYPKYLASLEDGLEPPGGQEDKLPSLQAPLSLPPHPPVKLQRLDCCSWRPFPHTFSFLPGLWGVGSSY